ncbi:MAG: hypothetical protein QOC81_3125 [Thermoanaerobaculia bacterium]|nr:hypothetical protein [Thermoanaerobaculia bacterium]
MRCQCNLKCSRCSDDDPVRRIAVKGGRKAIHLEDYERGERQDLNDSWSRRFE